MAGVQVLNDNYTMAYAFPASTAGAKGDLLYWDTVALVAKPAALLPPGASEAADQTTFAPLFMGVAQDVRLSSEADNKAMRTVVVQGIFEYDCVAGYTPALGDLVSVTRDGGAALVSQKLTHTGVTSTTAIGKVIDIPSQVAATKPWGTVQTRVRVVLNGRITDFP